MCTSEVLTEHRGQLMKWLKTIQEEIGDFECDNKEIRTIIIDAHQSIIGRFQMNIKDIDLKLEKIRINEYEKSRVAKHEEREKDHEDENQ